ncbi:Qat anti-phage system QueC-like protein QatC [Pseudobutyrivibrio sp.]|jgi:7-cyano-7-deazaguanine synthase in queuosine biosynthesis|uniref:Qat anti-phage system QueC-like protein QatC n=1 Tax=Pseudobutyrivibrio sp. TaxID=2014367 RepID=UPI0025CE3BE4|nr:Qat anti-phage system QueC-like protein QatC [Pseudobutyrivibrio sp.]
MKFWINKENDAEPTRDWNEAYCMSINRDSWSTIYSSVPSIWYHLGKQSMEYIYEDLFIIGLSVFALDKRISRSLFDDAWTREIEVSIPVLEKNKWDRTCDRWNELLSFLTGDIWKIKFRSTSAEYGFHKNANRSKIDISGCDCVSLFSGGLDSFCGAIKLLEDGKSPVLVGHNEYPKLRYIQENMVKDFRSNYDSQSISFLGFTAGARAPKNIEGEPLRKTENTSRGRSLLFLCAAISIAGIMGEDTPVYIPENGFIGLNISLTNSRKGSCSTRTTHPFFLEGLSEILGEVGIHNRIENFFAYKTKREIVNLIAETQSFKNNYMNTISCSHPCVARYNRTGSREYPVNCGFCYPCLIRKASLQDVEISEKNDVEDTISFINMESESTKSSDLFAVLSSVHRYKGLSDKELRRMIRCTGKLSKEKVEWFERVYREGMNDLTDFFKNEPDMEKYL